MSEKRKRLAVLFLSLTRYSPKQSLNHSLKPLGKSSKIPLSASVLLGLASILGLFVLSAVVASQSPPLLAEPLPWVRNQEPSLEAFSTESLRPLLTPSSSTAPEPIPEADTALSLVLERSDGGAETLNLTEYLWGVLAAEMPATFPLEALKAQAVAARTYTALRLENPSAKHSLGQICDDSGCCQAYMDKAERLESWGTEASFYEEKLNTALAETQGLYVLYDNSPIDAVFFSSAGGDTLEAQEVWGASLPYLQSVSSPEGEEVPNYYSQQVVSPQELSQTLLTYYPQMVLEGEPASWIGDQKLNSGGAVGELTLGGVAVTGTALRSLFGLRSAYFTLCYEAESFVFSVAGYGHGVGMSQYGAKALAETGADFAQILTHYYAGTEIAGYS